MLYRADIAGRMKVRKADAFYCNQCDIHMLSRQQAESFEEDGSRLFKIGETLHRDSKIAKSLARTLPPETWMKAPKRMESIASEDDSGRNKKTTKLGDGKQEKSIRHLKIGRKLYQLYDPENYHWDKIPNELYLISKSFKKCPACGKTLRPYTYPALIEKYNKCIKLDAQICFDCNSVYSAEVSLLQELENGKQPNTPYKLLYGYYYSKAANSESKILLDKIKSSYCRVILMANGDVRPYIIAKSEKDCDNKRVIHYTSDIALQILTALYFHDDKVVIEDKTFYIAEGSYARGKGQIILSPNDSVVVSERSGGGYYSTDENIVSVDALVFCGKTRRLEVLQMSHDTRTGEYFVDKGILKQFYSKYGVPLLSYGKKESSGFQKLNDESYLHMLGYNVNGRENLEQQKRHEILGNAMESGMQQPKIQKTLQFLINMNSNDPSCADACRKWKEDMEFIRNYKVSHDRFVFLDSVNAIAKNLR